MLYDSGMSEKFSIRGSVWHTLTSLSEAVSYTVVRTGFEIIRMGNACGQQAVTTWERQSITNSWSLELLPAHVPFGSTPCNVILMEY